MMNDEMMMNKYNLTTSENDGNDEKEMIMLNKYNLFIKSFSVQIKTHSTTMENVIFKFP